MTMPPALSERNLPSPAAPSRLRQGRATVTLRARPAGAARKSATRAQKAMAHHAELEGGPGGCAAACAVCQVRLETGRCRLLGWPKGRGRQHRDKLEPKERQALQARRCTRVRVTVPPRPITTQPQRRQGPASSLAAPPSAPIQRRGRIKLPALHWNVTVFDSESSDASPVGSPLCSARTTDGAAETPGSRLLRSTAL